MIHLSKNNFSFGELNKLVILFGYLFTLTSCFSSSNKKTSKPENHLDRDASFLLGCWQNKIGNEPMYEEWQKVNDTLYAGISYIIIEKDTVLLETMQVTAAKGAMLFTAVTKNQNDEKPVDFIRNQRFPETLLFENLTHDFPQKISYHAITNDSMYAEIEGKSKGQQKTIGFPFHRVKK